MSNPAISAKSKAEIAARASKPDTGAMLCPWCGNGTPSERRAGKGLSPVYCFKHMRHLQRHGHPAKPSYSCSEYLPFVKIAEKFLKAALGEKNPYGLTPANMILVKGLVDSLEGLLSRSGQPVDFPMPRQPKARCRAILGLLRARYCDGLPGGHVRHTMPVRELALRVAARVLGFRLAYFFDPSGPGDADFLAVQIGKAIHRMAGGHHKAFEWGTGTTLHLNKYSVSRGRSLLLLGRTLLDKDLVWDTMSGRLKHRAMESLKANPVRDWRNALGTKSTRGGLRRKPYRKWPECAANRIVLGGAR